jgi:hypothetical protein
VQQDPSLIKNMIQSNGNGTYSVDFHVNGQDDFVTVNNELVVNTSKNSIANLGGDNLMFNGASNDMWAGLVEKAYAQLQSQSGVTTDAGVGNIDSYSAIDGGLANGLSAVTGQGATTQTITSSTSTSAAQGMLATLQSAFASGQGVMLATDNKANSDFDIVPNHMYSVTGVNASAGTVTVFNPWGNGVSAFGDHATFTMTIAQLQQQGVYLYEATGKAAAA